MPFQSEKQRRYLHANHPDIANRWEKKYGLGGIAQLNAQLNQLPEYYLPVAQGGRIGFAEGPKTYEAWLDYRIKQIAKGLLPVPFERWKKGEIKMNQGGFIPAHQAGVLGLAEGGNVRLGPHKATDLLVKKTSTGERPKYQPPGHEDRGWSPGVSHSGSPADTGRGHDYEGEAYGTPDSIASLTSSTTPDDSGDDDKALSYVNWNKPTIEDTKDSSDKKKTLLKHIGDASGVNLNKYIYGIEQPKEKKSKGSLVFDTLFAIATGGLSLTEKLGANWLKTQVKSNFAKQQETKKLIDSLPINHPERIELLSKMKIKTPPTDERDGSSIKIEEIETVNKTKAQIAKDEEYLKMQEAAYLAYLEQQRRRQVYLDNYRQMFLANKGGLAGLFRVKNS